MADVKLPLVVRKAVRDLESKKEERLAKLGSLLGGTWTLQLDLAEDCKTMHWEPEKPIGEHNEQYPLVWTHWVEATYDHALGMFISQLEPMLEDEFNKEAIEGALSAKTIAFDLQNNGVKIANGIYYYSVGKNDFNNKFGKNLSGPTVGEGVKGEYSPFKDVGKNLLKMV